MKNIALRHYPRKDALFVKRPTSPSVGWNSSVLGLHLQKEASRNDGENHSISVPVIRSIPYSLDMRVLLRFLHPRSVPPGPKAKGFSIKRLLPLGVIFCIRFARQAGYRKIMFRL